MCTAYRKACATAAACFIASAGYQLFCMPGRLGSVCISCCSGPLCNGPHPLHSGSEARGLSITEFTVIMLGVHLLL
uniref:Uncharacterized protein n=1 Tax=Eptatretus burgeri TaxID=7764 RepID=A0A8C4QTM3_EPTBU